MVTEYFVFLVGRIYALVYPLCMPWGWSTVDKRGTTPRSYLSNFTADTKSKSRCASPAAAPMMIQHAYLNQLCFKMNSYIILSKTQKNTTTDPRWHFYVNCLLTPTHSISSKTRSANSMPVNVINLTEVQYCPVAQIKVYKKSIKSKVKT